MKHFYKHFYRKHTYSIFAPGLDRFILTDTHDYWITMQTAELLCSKLPTVMFILPEIELNNPTDFTLINKSQHKIGISAISNARQYPQMKYIQNNNEVVYVGQHVDYTIEQMDNLKQFANYIHELSYAINITEALYNPYDNSVFLEKYIGLDNINGLTYKNGRGPNNVFSLIRRTIYESSTIEEIDQNIIKIWLENYNEQEYLIRGFYYTLGVNIPTELKEHITFIPITLSSYIV
jgi:hypothetical protein